MGVFQPGMVRLEFQLPIDLFCLVIGMRMTFVSSAKQNSFLGGELGAVVGDYVERGPMEVENVICKELNGFHCCGQWRKGNAMSGVEKGLTVVSITILIKHTSKLSKNLFIREIVVIQQHLSNSLVNTLRVGSRWVVRANEVSRWKL